MVATASRRRPARAVSAPTVWRVAAAAAIMVLAVLCVGGYVFHWQWCGLSASVTLWDWLEVLALPVAIATAPLLLRHRRHLHRQHRFTIAVVLTCFVGLAFAGYVVPLRWTGFRGNTLWDWLQLVLLPLVVASTSTLWASDRRPQRRHFTAAGVGLGAFAVLAICGYLVPMRWTGFTGNTLWDWIKLLLLPVVIPTILVPMLSQRMSERLSRTAPPAAPAEPRSSQIRDNSPCP